MECVIVSIGDELTTGAITDTNSAWISDLLLGLGIATVMHITVPDDIEAVKDVFMLSGERAKNVIVTGGLGPTEDDLTRDAFCEFAGVGTTLDHESIDKIKKIFDMLGREMTENNRKQAMIPDGANIIPNPIGTAPGFYAEAHGATYFFVPGVPRECRMMMEDTVAPVLKGMDRDATYRIRVFRTFGMTESQLDTELSDLSLPGGVKLGYRAVYPEIHVKLLARAKTEEEAESLLEQASAGVRERIGEVIYSEDGNGLPEVVLDLLKEKGKMLATAESCTGGLVAKRITDVPGSSDGFERGFVTYTNRAKQELLGVSSETLEKHGAVSSETALEMASGALERSGADIAVAITGIAGPTGGTEEKPVGTVHIALADEDGTWENRFNFSRGDRTQVRELTAQAALEIVRRRLIKKDLPSMIGKGR